MKNSNIEYIDYYIKELESRHGDIDKINELKRLRNLYLQQEENKKQEKLNTKKQCLLKKKKKIKRPSMKKQICIGILVGTIIGVPTGMIAYNSVINSPSAHNYKTVREERLNLQHDDSNYRKYLRKIGLTEEEIQKRIDEEEKRNKWNREPDELDER